MDTSNLLITRPGPTHPPTAEQMVGDLYERLAKILGCLENIQAEPRNGNGPVASSDPCSGLMLGLSATLHLAQQIEKVSVEISETIGRL